MSLLPLRIVMSLKIVIVPLLHDFMLNGLELKWTIIVLGVCVAQAKKKSKEDLLFKLSTVSKRNLYQ